MTISKFCFEDKVHGWKLNEVFFNDLNLLVGKSGVGKTQILNAIASVRRAGIKNTKNVGGCIWKMEVLVDEDLYCWSAKTASVKSEQISIFEHLGEETLSTGESPRFLSESIIKNENEVLVDRNKSKFTFNGKPLPKLKNTDSAIELLRDEESIAPLHGALSRFIFSEASDLSSILKSRLLAFDNLSIDRYRQKYRSLTSLREATEIPMLVKAYILQEDHPEEFSRIKNDYIEIFSTVTDIRLGKLSEIAPSALADAPSFVEWLALGIKEKGVKGWIANQQISAGMLRTLIHLTEITLAPPGTVVIIDEFENSLGVNCLPQLTEHLLRRADLQFILTSHHPYIINNVPWRYWKLVTRNGAEVTVKDAASIPSLNTASSLEKFTLLMNAEEYEEAIR